MQFWLRTERIGTSCHLILNFTVLEAVASVLKPLHVFTDALAGEKHITISAIRPLLRHIVEQIVLVGADDCTIVKEMKGTIAEQTASSLHSGRDIRSA